MELSSLEMQHNQNVQKRETQNGSHPSMLLNKRQMTLDHEEAQYIINQQQQMQKTNQHHSNSIVDLAQQQQQQQNHVSTQEIQRTAFARAHFRHVAVRGLIGELVY